MKNLLLGDAQKTIKHECVSDYFLDTSIQRLKINAIKDYNKTEV